MLPISNQILLEIQKHEKTLEQVIIFQNDQAKVNRMVAQKLAAMEARMTTVEDNLERILNLMTAKTVVK